MIVNKNIKKHERTSRITNKIYITKQIWGQGKAVVSPRVRKNSYDIMILAALAISKT